MADYTQPQVARQPIFDLTMDVESYELLFRSGVEGVLADRHPESSTTGVVSTTLFGIGTDRLTGGKIGFVNFPRKLLVGGYAQLLSPQALGIEILGSVVPDEQTRAAVAELHELGFRIAIDDVMPGDSRLEFAPFAEIAKIDFHETTADQRRIAAAEWSDTGLALLGMRIETTGQFDEALTLGCALFQGYFFAEPVVIPGHEVTGSKLAHLRMLQLVTRPDISIDRVEELVKSDVALSYKLLRYINSAAFGWRHRIGSVHQALVLLGEREIRKWVALVSLTSMGSDKPLELAVKSVIRGRMCEALAAMLGAPERAADMFFAGILSHVDALSSQPMETALENVHVADDVHAALLHKEGATLPATALAIVAAYEAADWERLSELCEAGDLSEDQVTDVYQSAVVFGRELLNA